ncbi:MAG: ATP synthase F1 subunit delta [bacterium]|nr:ATP synthase F1 subunit delta [bacterium]
MKITPKQYARSFYEVVSQAETDGDIKIVIKNFTKLLAARQMLTKSKLVIKEFVNIWNFEKGIVEGKIVSAKALDDEVIEKIKQSLKQNLNIKEIKADNKIDEKIIGGFIAKFGYTIIDASIKNKLQILKNKLVS